MLVHAAALALAVDPDGPLVGVLILGASGAGKSMLALAAVEECPFRRTALVADDAVVLERAGEGVGAAAPAPIRGLVEVRGFGPAPIRSAPSALLVAAFDLSLAPDRLPEARRFEPGEGLVLPLFPFVAGVAGSARLRIAMRAIMGGQTP